MSLPFYLCFSLRYTYNQLPLYFLFVLFCFPFMFVLDGNTLYFHITHVWGKERYPLLMFGLRFLCLFNHERIVEQLSLIL